MPTPDPVSMFLILLAVALITPLLSALFRIPPIVGLILGGIVVGPHGLGLLAINDTVELFATVGLIYLMFNVGLEVDLHQFSAYKKRTLIFFLLTYLIPQVSGLFNGWVFGLSLNSAILIGAIYASYTLVAYPIVTQLGIIKNEAVAITVGANVLSDVTALLILTLVMHAQSAKFLLLDALSLSVMILAYFVAAVFVIPNLCRLFFERFKDVKIGFLFVLVLLFTSAYIAQISGIHAILGAFFGGLAMSQTLPKESRVIKQTLFTGEAIFIPFFLVTLGLRIDLKEVLSNWQTLYIGLSLTASVYITKFIAAYIATRMFNYSRAQMWTIWGLSQAQAAATLAIILIATKANLFPPQFLQGAIIMVFLTLLSSPILVRYYGAMLKPIDRKTALQPLFKRILFPTHTDNPTNNTLEFTSRLARHAQGKLLVLNTASSKEALEVRREKIKAGPIKDPDTNIKLVNRIVEADWPKNILNEAVENEVSFIVMEWEKANTSTKRIWSQNLEEIIWNATVPVGVLLMNKPIKSFKRVVAVIGEHMVGIKLNDQFVDVLEDFSNAMSLPLTIMASPHYYERFEKAYTHLFGKTQTQLIAMKEDILEAVEGELCETDLIVIPTMGTKDRFDSKPNLLAFNILSNEKYSLLVLNTSR